MTSRMSWCWDFQLCLQELPPVTGINRISESKQHVLPSSELLICKYLTVKGLTWRESLDTYVMDISSDPSGQTCSLRPEPASSLATINSKQMEKLLYSLIQLSKPFDFRIPRLLLDFSCLSSSLARLIGEGYQCKFWFWSSPLSNFPHLTMLIASLSSFGVKTVWFFPILSPSAGYYNALKGSVVNSLLRLHYFSHTFLPASHQVRLGITQG